MDHVISSMFNLFLKLANCAPQQVLAPSPYQFHVSLSISTQKAVAILVRTALNLYMNLWEILPFKNIGV